MGPSIRPDGASGLLGIYGYVRVREVYGMVVASVLGSTGSWGPVVREKRRYS